MNLECILVAALGSSFWLDPAYNYFSAVNARVHSRTRMNLVQGDHRPLFVKRGKQTSLSDIVWSVAQHLNRRFLKEKKKKITFKVFKILFKISY